MKRCQLCNRKLSKRWNYCPRCGAEVSKKINMFNLLRRQMDILRNLMLEDDFDHKIQSPRNAITIRIDSGGFRNPRIQQYPQPKSDKEDDRTFNPRKLKGKIVEPKVSVKRLSDAMTYRIPLPDVKSEKDIELNRLTDSLEIRAFAKDKGYFKILNIPKNHKLVNKNLENGTLNLKFSI